MWLAIAVVATQRIALPLGEFQIPLTTILFLTFFVSRVLARRWEMSAPRVVVFAAFAACAGVSAMVSGPTLNMVTAAGFVLVLWLPVIALPSDPNGAQTARSFGLGLIVATGVAGYAGSAQYFTTLAGGAFFDPLSYLPAGFQVSGYRSAQTVGFGSDWYKANAFVFLEPSFLSLISALCLLILASGMVILRGRQTAIVLTGLALGLLTSGAISGALLMPVVLLSLVRSVRTLIVALFSAAMFGAAISLTPIAQAFIQRLIFSDGSNDARLVRPYYQLLPVWSDGGVLVGLGPGSARIEADRITAGQWQTEVTTPTLVKLLFEYGLLGATIMAALVGLAMFSANVPALLKVGALVAVAIPTDGLTSHLLVPVFLMLLFPFEGQDGVLPFRPRPFDRARRTASNSSIALSSLSSRLQ